MADMLGIIDIPLNNLPWVATLSAYPDTRNGWEFAPNAYLPQVQWKPRTPVNSSRFVGYVVTYDGPITLLRDAQDTGGGSLASNATYLNGRWNVWENDNPPWKWNRLPMAASVGNQPYITPYSRNVITLQPAGGPNQALFSDPFLCDTGDGTNRYQVAALGVSDNFPVEGTDMVQVCVDGTPLQGAFLTPHDTSQFFAGGPLMVNGIIPSGGNVLVYGGNLNYPAQLIYWNVGSTALWDTVPITWDVPALTNAMQSGLMRVSVANNGWIFSFQTNGSGPTGQPSEIALVDLNVQHYVLLRVHPQTSQACDQLTRSAGPWSCKIDKYGQLFVTSCDHNDVDYPLYTSTTLPQVLKQQPTSLALECFQPCTPLP